MALARLILEVEIDKAECLPAIFFHHLVARMLHFGRRIDTIGIPVGRRRRGRRIAGGQVGADGTFPMPFGHGLARRAMPHRGMFGGAIAVGRHGCLRVVVHMFAGIGGGFGIAMRAMVFGAAVQSAMAHCSMLGRAIRRRAFACRSHRHRRAMPGMRVGLRRSWHRKSKSREAREQQGSVSHAASSRGRTLTTRIIPACI